MKKATRDYLYSDLPKTRRAAFFDRLKMDPWRFVGLGAILLLFASPLLLFMGASDFAISRVDLNEETAKETLFSLRFYRSLLLVPLGMIFSLGIAGVNRILRQECWDEPVFFWSDFFRGIKNGYAEALCQSFLIGLLLFLRALGDLWQIYPSFASGILLGIIAFAVFPASFHSLCLSQIYSISVFRCFRGGYTAYFHSFLGTLAVAIAFVAPLMLDWIPSLLLRYIGFAVVIFFYLPLVMFASFLYALSVYDPLINQKDYLELLKKGIYPDEDKSNH